MNLRSFVRSAGMTVLLAGVALVASSCAQQKPAVVDEKPEPAPEQKAPQPAPETAVPAPAPGEMPPPAPEEGMPSGKMKKHKAARGHAAKETKHKGRRHGKEEIGGGRSILAELQSAGTFKTFVRLIKAADLSKMFNTKGPYTVLAPTDKAFAKMPGVDRMIKSGDKAELQHMVFAHTLVGRVSSGELKGLKVIQSFDGKKYHVRSELGRIHVGSALVGQQEIRAGNGVIHPIYSVLTASAGDREEVHKKSKPAKSKSKRGAKSSKSDAAKE